MDIVEERAFLKRPAGAMVLGGAWLYGSPDGKLYFSIVFGPVDEAGQGALARLWRAELATRGHVSLCDAGGVTSITPQAFAVLGAFLDENREALAARVTRQALVRPRGLTGALVAGYYRVFPPPYPYEVFETRAAALRWLGYPADALAPAEAHAVGDPLLRELRELLARGRAEARSLPRAARALAVSPRSLQRRLGAVGTSFLREVKRAQIERAMRLLATTDQKLAAVAAEVGCASLSSFSEMFAREVGMPPSRWRGTFGPRDGRPR